MPWWIESYSLDWVRNSGGRIKEAKITVSKSWWRAEWAEIEVWRMERSHQQIQYIDKHEDNWAWNWTKRTLKS
jgi:hypothetical protein